MSQTRSKISLSPPPRMKNITSYSTSDSDDSDCGYDDDDDEYSSSGASDDGSPIRYIRCLKKKDDMKRFDEEEDCYILGFDPTEPVGFSKLSLSEPADENYDLLVVGEKGQVACRDYPHPRHLCVNFPFGTMPHEKCCDKCCCYVCERKAPCALWISPGQGHCHATEHDIMWKRQRENWKQK